MIARGAAAALLTHHRKGNAQHDRVLDRRDLVDARPDGRIGRESRRDPVRQVGGRADRLAWDDDEPGIQRCVVHADRVEALADFEPDGLSLVLEHPPVAAGPRLETRPPEDERSMVSVLELLVGVDAPVDPDVPAATRRGDLERLGDGHLRGRGQQSSDAVPRSERPEDGSAEDEGEHTRGSEEKGTHGPDHIRGGVSGSNRAGLEPRRARTAPGMKGPEGTYPRRGR